MRIKESKVKRRLSDLARRRQSGLSTPAAISPSSPAIHSQNLLGSMDFFAPHAFIISDSSDPGSIPVPEPSIPINTESYGVGTGGCVVV